jgi:hypothetical protein
MKLKVLTIDLIKDRCVEDGDCLLWQGAMCGDKPTARHDGGQCNVRRLFWCLTNPSKTLKAEQVLRVTCHDTRCLLHVVRTSRSALMRRTAQGLRGNLVVTASRTAARRRRSKLSQEAVAQIRTDPRPQRQLAEAFGVSRRTVQRIQQLQTWAPMVGSSVFRAGAAA